MGNSVTLRDVATAAGVSEATVSYVVNGRAEKVGIPAATRARVLEVARRVGYKPNTVARDLALGHLSGGRETVFTDLTVAGYRLVPVASVEALMRLPPEGLVGVVYKLSQEVPHVLAPNFLKVDADVSAASAAGEDQIGTDAAGTSASTTMPDIVNT